MEQQLPQFVGEPMKKHRPRPAARRKPRARPQPQRVGRGGTPASSSEVADLVKASVRAAAAMMPPDEREDFLFVTSADAPETPEVIARHDAYMDRYQPSRDQIEAALAEIRAEYEAKSRGSFAADVRATTDITHAYIRETLSPVEQTAFDAARQHCDLNPDDEAASEKYMALFNRYKATIDNDELNSRLHREGVGIDQIMRRYSSG
jgi:hypothetical protein